MSFLRPKTELVTAENALRGHPAIPLPGPGNPLRHRPSDSRAVRAGRPETAVFGMGCFWGAEKDFWELPEVWSTAVGYAGGFTAYPPTSRPAPAGPGTPRWSG